MRILSLLLCFCLISIIGNTQTVYKEIVSIKYPISAIEAKDKTAFLYKTQEELRLLHNQKGDDHREKRITEQKWNQWLEKYFNPRSIIVSNQICVQREIFKTSSMYSVDLDKDFNEKIN